MLPWLWSFVQFDTIVQWVNEISCNRGELVSEFYSYSSAIMSSAILSGHNGVTALLNCLTRSTLQSRFTRYIRNNLRSNDLHRSVMVQKICQTFNQSVKKVLLTF
ncbi:hypothetical protein J6590_031928 [Homalodisca vitripennis]|nr:hypothetical protein J6590_031928 [Homalodisca vitripennis]